MYFIMLGLFYLDDVMFILARFALISLCQVQHRRDDGVIIVPSNGGVETVEAVEHSPVTRHDRS